MKIFSKTVIGIAFLLLSIAPAYAQFTVLPYTEKSNMECKAVINEYEASGVFPLGANEKAASEKPDCASKNLGVSDKAACATSQANGAQTELNKLKEKIKTATEKYQANCAPDPSIVEQYQSQCYDNGGKDFDRRAKCTDLRNQMDAPKEKNKSTCDALYNALGSVKSDGTFDNNGKLTSQLSGAEAELKARKATEQQAIDAVDAARSKNDLLGCAIKTGKISLAMIPFFIMYITNFLLSLVGLVSVFFIVIGGYRYVFAGLTDDKDKGKKTIRDALLGMVLAILAWSLVNIILRAISG